jgi:3-phosphoshikimate 1-carboxyvinyltransferase
MTVTITPVRDVRSQSEEIRFTVGPDKSILHRLFIIGALTKSHFTIPIRSIESLSHDVLATALAMESLGAPIEVNPTEIELQGVGRRGLRAPGHTINCANSGTTARLLMGLLSGQNFDSTLAGDRSLSARPMRRLAQLLADLGARIQTSPNGSLPASIFGERLQGNTVALPVASAQMKSAAMLAALFADGLTTVREPLGSRDHTERMFAALGFGVDRSNEAITIDPTIEMEIDEEIEYQVPGDISSAAFLIVAAILLRRRIAVERVLLNPTRTRFLDMIAVMGVDVEFINAEEHFGELCGDVIVYGDRLSDPLAPFEITPEDVPLLLDDIPALMTLALFADGVSSVHGAHELRLKETDRLKALADQFHAFGVEVHEYDDGISVVGEPRRALRHASIEHHGDHRMAMAFAIASLFADGPSTISEAEVGAVSYPEFFEHLRTLVGEDHIRVA